MREKLTGFAFTLIGIVNVLSAISLIYFINNIGELLETLSGFLALFNAPILQSTSYTTIGYVFAILQLITGIVALSAGISILVKQKRVRKKNGTY
jgi:hypothetical protein